MSLMQAIHAFFTHYGVNRTYWVGTSGGLDSHALLSLCHQARTCLPIRLCAIHVNHQISLNAASWGQHCAQVCKEFEIDYIERRTQIEVKTGQSIENEARQKRYEIFAEHMTVNDVLLTAHHEDDQAETVLLQLFRGAGLKGLAAMPLIKPFAVGFHARPLLSFSRQQLLQYAMAQGLQWIEDESNFNHNLTRNYIRHDVLPLLQTRWPAITNTLSRSATHCGEAQALLEEYAAAECLSVKVLKENRLSVSKLLALSPMKQKLLLRTWIHQSGHLLPNTKKLEGILYDVLLARPDRTPCVSWGNVELRRYRDNLYLITKRKDLCMPKNYLWDLAQQLTLPGLGFLQAVGIKGRGLRADITKVSVRFREGGEIAQIPGRGHQALKNLFQEWGIPPWQRNQLPLLYLQDQLIAVTGRFIHPDFKANANELGHEIFLTPET